jgi:hypothetical protein
LDDLLRDALPAVNGHLKAMDLAFVADDAPAAAPVA